MNRLLLSLTIVLIGITGTKAQESFYDIKVNTLEGEAYTLSELKGKKIMVVNTASKCKYTKQYEMLELLYKKYEQQGFIVLAFPSESFGDTEFEDDEEIRTFCTKHYDITFPIFEKVEISKSEMHPIYQWLTQKSKNGKQDSKVKWNFQKYLIDENGQLVDVLSPGKKPYNKDVIEWIES
ncbi:glutathione peroxidase [Carboxylicivirga sp. N1Y90]|uniref:glutathione peroxidase n=1 Tax=Carboxylicivirga fragile TaxID=3417571 RepID=UPI003D34CEBF|nr:glutathione peroxidase [Marinilabiliaceae bacterium N1Y90]